MTKRVFISCNHKQGDWVWDRLVPCLQAGGAEIVIDRERFEAGKAVVGQMDATQDAAGISVLILSPNVSQAATAPAWLAARPQGSCPKRFGSADARIKEAQ